MKEEDPDGFDGLGKMIQAVQDRRIGAWVNYTEGLFNEYRDEMFRQDPQLFVCHKSRLKRRFMDLTTSRPPQTASRSL
jgi:hypothetical protein